MDEWGPPQAAQRRTGVEPGMLWGRYIGPLHVKNLEISHIYLTLIKSQVQNDLNLQVFGDELQHGESKHFSYLPFEPTLKLKSIQKVKVVKLF